MNVTTPAPAKQDMQGLIDAILQATAEDSLSNPLKPEQWDIFSAYLQPCHLASGQLLINQGANDRTLYFIESGSLSVHYEDDKGRLRMAIVGPGTVVGEGAFFSQRPRGAAVQAAAASKLWTLSALRFTEMSNRQPAIALAVVMAAGGVLSKRLSNRRRRVAVT